MIATGRIADEHGSFSRTCQVARICTPVQHMIPRADSCLPTERHLDRFILACRACATSMMSVCLSVCNVGGLRSRGATKYRIDRCLGYICTSKPTLMVISCDAGCGICVFLHLCDIQRLACLAISASAQLLFVGITVVIDRETDTQTRRPITRKTYLI